MATTPAISVVIPTYNRRDRWPSVLEGLAAQTFPMDELEVVVVSDGSTDGTDEYLEGVSTAFEFVFVRQRNAGPAPARNRGVELARAPIVVFLDDDIVATPTLIEGHALDHERSAGDVAVIGPMLSPPDAHLSAPVRWEQAMLYKQYDAMRRGDYAPTYRQFFTGNASVKRARIVAAGGFDGRFRRAEDVELAYRMWQAGLGFVFDPDAVAYHYANRSFRSWLLNAHAYGVNDVMFARDHAEVGLLERTRREFWRRHPLVRVTTRACVARPRVERTMEWTLHSLAWAAESVGARDLTRYALSGLYNLAYYCGMADEMGGAEAFNDAVARFPEENLPIPVE